MKKKQTKRILRIVLAIGTPISLFFVPWILVWAWILPLPDTVQEQVNEAIGHGFDGMIVYVDEAGTSIETFTIAKDERFLVTLLNTDLSDVQTADSLINLGNCSTIFLLKTTSFWQYYVAIIAILQCF